MGSLLEEQIVELKKQLNVTRVLAYGLIISGGVLCVGLYSYLYLVNNDVETLLGMGPGFVSAASSVLPFNNMSKLARRLKLMSGLNRAYHQNAGLSDEERDDHSELVKQALKNCL